MPQPHSERSRGDLAGPASRVEQMLLAALVATADAGMTKKLRALGYVD